MFRCLALLLVASCIGISACVRQQLDNVRLEARPLGKESSTRPVPTLHPLLVDEAKPAPETATGPLTLHQALSMALLKNPELAAFSWEIRAGEARTLQAGLLPNPELDVVVENFGNSALEGVDGATTTIQVSQSILLGGKRSKRARLASVERDVTGWEYEVKRLDVLTDVRKAFVDVLAAQERLALSEELTRLAGEVCETVSERVKAGRVSPVEETKSRTSLATARIELERAKRELAAARKRLVAMWGDTAPTFEKAAGQFDETRPIPPEEQLASYVSQNPDIARWAAEMEQRRAAVALEKARWIPEPTLSGGFRHFNEANEGVFLVGVSIPVPLFDRNQGGILEAKYKLAKANEERLASEVRVRSALAEAYRSLSTAFVETSVLKNEVLPGLRSAFEAAMEGYRQGKFGYLEVLDSQRTFFDARGRYLEALASYHKAVADVERLIAEPLDSVKNPTE